MMVLLFGLTFYLLWIVRPKGDEKIGEIDRTLYIGSVRELPPRSKKNLRRIEGQRILRKHFSENSPSSSEFKMGRREKKS